MKNEEDEMKMLKYAVLYEGANEYGMKWRC